MKDYAKLRADREIDLQRLGNERHQLEQQVAEVQRIIDDPSRGWFGPAQGPNIGDVQRIRQQKLEIREDLWKRIEKVRGSEDGLLRQQQIDFAEQQSELAEAAATRDREFAERQDAFTRKQWRVTRTTQVIAAVSGVAAVGAAVYTAYLIKRQPPPICSPAQVQVQAPPPIPPPEVTVTLDSKALPLKKVVTPRGTPKQKP
jgi:hypothetical protein